MMRKIKRIALKQTGIFLHMCIRKYNQIVLDEKNKEVQRKNKKFNN